jgi:hypothetical protein
MCSFLPPTGLIREAFESSPGRDRLLSTVLEIDEAVRRVESLPSIIAIPPGSTVRYFS